MAPHISEELWWRLNNNRANQRSNQRKSASIFKEKWPRYDEKLIKEDKFTLIIQINGKVRDKIELETDISKEEAKTLALSREKVQKRIRENKIKKVIFVPDKLINIVV
jgi:leucyl-tRNA synthetase